MYIGFGSIFGRDPKRVTQIVREAVRRTGVRAILARGWGGLEPSDSAHSESFLFIEAAPHSWLFPQVSAVVHHGGCGTTAAGLLAGKPNISMSVLRRPTFLGATRRAPQSRADAHTAEEADR